MADTRKTLSEVKAMAVGEKFSAVAVVTDIHEKKDKNGKSFWTMAVMDKSGYLEGKAWSNSQWWDYKENVKTEIKDPQSSSAVSNLKNTTVGMTGQIAEFKGKIQYNFNQIFLLDQKKDEYRPESFVPKSPYDPAVLEESFDGLVSLCSGEIFEFLKKVFGKDSELWRQYRIMPAAVSHHHAYVHGLLEHSIGVTKLALSMAETVEGPAKPDISLVIAGGLLHDIGKIEAYELAPGPGMTVQGNVIDHVALGYSRFERLAEGFGMSSVNRVHLGHILLSHHGLREYGSPVLPATPEALIVAAADELDFKLFCFGDSVSSLKGGLNSPKDSVSEFSYSAQRRFWKWRKDGSED